MPQTARTDRAARFGREFFRWLFVVALLTALGTGIAVYIAAPDTDRATVQDPYWSVVKWYVWDIHAVFGLLMAAAGGLWFLLRALAPPQSGDGSRRITRRLLPIGAALLTAWLVSQWVIDAHPVFVPSVRATAFPAGPIPEQVTLTWDDDPATTQTIQWRTAPGVEDHELRYRPGAFHARWQSVTPETDLIADPFLINDGPLAWHTATLTGLKPGKPYEYQVRSGPYWTEPATFETAPAEPAPFSFAYLGDVQRGFDVWGGLLEKAYARDPGIAFAIVAGDLVDDGVNRDQWDAFLHFAGPVFGDIPIVPAIGNHDDDDNGDPWMYLQYFGLPRNGPETVEPERVYHFTYGNALFVILDTNLPPETQTAWLDKTLAASDAAWKIVVAHHPLYASKPHRDNPELRDAWLPVFYAHDVHLVLQGHDHAYMRTHPMRGGVPVDDPAHGTTFVVTVAGTKFYEQEQRDYMAVAYPELPTYQLIDIDGDTLRYRAYSLDDELVDEFTIEQ